MYALVGGINCRGSLNVMQPMDFDEGDVSVFRNVSDRYVAEIPGAYVEGTTLLPILLAPCLRRGVVVELAVHRLLYFSRHAGEAGLVYDEDKNVYYVPYQFFDRLEELPLPEPALGDMYAHRISNTGGKAAGQLAAQDLLRD